LLEQLVGVEPEQVRTVPSVHRTDTEHPVAHSTGRMPMSVAGT